MPAKIQVHGHRGSRGTHPENSLPAFEEAIDSGADFVEMDIHLSSDEIPVVFHDAAISSRLCREPSGRPVQEPRIVHTLTAAEIGFYEIGRNHHEEFPDQKKIPNLKIPTLERFFRWYQEVDRRVGLNLELKIPKPPDHPIPDYKTLTGKVVNLLRKYKLLNKAIIQSFDFRVLEYAIEMERGLTCSFLFNSNRDFPETLLWARRKIEKVIAAPRHPLVTKDRVDRCHDFDIPVIPWTVNSKDEWDRLLHCGVDGLITDYPRLLIDHLKAKQRAEG